MTITETTAACTGIRYLLNPDCPEEGTDIHHETACPVHGPLSPIQVVARRRQVAGRCGYRDGFYGRPQRTFIFETAGEKQAYQQGRNAGRKDQQAGVEYGE